MITSQLDELNHLKQLPRTGWLLAGISDPESIADHTCGVAMLAMLLTNQINEDWMSQGISEPLSLERILCLALVHDMAESVLTDLPRRSTELLGEEMKHIAEAKAMAQLFADSSQGDQYTELWAEYSSATTAEARLVKDADKLEMVHQAFCYERRGYINLQEFWKGHPSQMVFEQLCQRRGN